MKNIVLTIDYELFLGGKTGSVHECMIEPTKWLSSILEKNNSKMTIFWDFLHYYRLLELEKKFSELEQDRHVIEKQILDLAKSGHDVQLHLHPHWLDANYEDGKWNFKYERFKLHDLSSDIRNHDINTITGCVSISKKLMEDLIRKVNPDYKVNAFRAGGYLIEPFDKIKDALLMNEIKIDSSVCPGSIRYNENFSFDFRYYPKKTNYNFEITPKDVLTTGQFTEIPITTVRVPAFINIFFTFLRKIKYPNLAEDRKGSGTSEYSKLSRMYIPRKLYSLTQARINQLTTDSSYKERFGYLIRKVSDYSTMIIHPKLLNNHTLNLINDYVSTNKIRFISIQDFLS
jgi:hypothetical protein